MTLALSIFFSIVMSFIPFSFGQPLKVTSDMALPNNYERRANVDQTDLLKFIYYSGHTKAQLNDIKDSELQSFRCGDGIIRTIQGAYVLESTKTPFGEKRRIQNQDFIEFMRKKEPDLARNKRILTSKVCELNDKTILLFYTVGEYDFKESDAKTARLVVLNSYNNQAFVQIIPKSVFSKTSIFKIKESASHTRCDKPFQITATNNLYIMCEEKKNFESIYSIYKFDLKTGDYTIIETCTNGYRSGLKSSCKQN